MNIVWYELWTSPYCLVVTLWKCQYCVIWNLKKGFYHSIIWKELSENVSNEFMQSCNYYYCFFSIRVFFHKQSQITELQGKGESLPLTPHYHFHPLDRHLDIIRVITAESSPLHIGKQPDSNREPLVFEHKSQITNRLSLTI